MRRQFVFSSFVSLLLLMHLTVVCNGFAAKFGEDDLLSLTKRLTELINKNHENDGSSHEDSENLDDHGEEHDEPHTGEHHDNTDDEHGEEHDEPHTGEHHDNTDDEHGEEHMVDHLGDTNLHEENAEKRNRYEGMHRWNSKYRGSINQGGSRSGPGLTQAQQDRVVEKHNQLRKGENAADMQKLKYNDNLARLAQEWADRCGWGHRPHDSFQPADYGFKTVGENIWAWSDASKEIPDAPIQDWFNEKDFYDYNSITCNKEPCGHYTAVTWASTREVGCGLSKCATLQNAGMTNAIYFVCNYGPGGNDYGKRPYTKGESCSACTTGKFFCTDGLCDDSCTSADQNGGCHCKAKCGDGTQTSECRCQCNPGATGVSCNDKCEDKNIQCGANPGWPEMFCHKETFGGMMYDMVNAECPKMCKQCVSKKREGQELPLLRSLLKKMIAKKN